MKRIIFGLTLSLLLLISLLVACGDGDAVAGVPDTLDNQARVAQLASELEDAVTVENVRAHQQVWQDIAEANNNNRFAGLPGYELSAEYVYDLLEEAGYAVSFQEFTYRTSRATRPPELQQAAPNSQTYTFGADFFLQTFSGNGTVRSTVTAVDLDLGVGNASTSGCEASDFASFPDGDIALIQRGGCSFALKAETAQAAGAVGVVIFNQGDTSAAARRNVFSGTLGQNTTTTIPVLSSSYDLGVVFSETDALELRLSANADDGTLTTRNVIAESLTGDPENVVMIGAHLDSVIGGPGIQDNGSGSAAILEVALQLENVFAVNTQGSSALENKVRFAWWSAEESGLIGSNFYVNDLAQNDSAGLGDISLYLNFDMIGSPNFFRGIYDGDQSDFRAPVPVPEGSAQIEQVLEEFYEENNLAYQGSQFSGRSDYQAFIRNGIPAGGLFTGAEGRKTQREAQLYGGAANVPYDLCYHRACDDIDNVNLEVLSQNSDAIAYALSNFALRDTGSILNAPVENELAMTGAPAEVKIDLIHDANLVTE